MRAEWYHDEGHNEDAQSSFEEDAAPEQQRPKKRNQLNEKSRYVHSD
jgi:hypothetical protein